MKGRQFGRNSSHRKAMFRSLVTSLIEHEKIETTEAKAKEIRGIAEKMITLGKKGDLHAKRMAMSFIRSRDVVAKLFTDVAGRVANREGGYTRIVKTRVRYGDSAPMAVLELVDKPGEVYKAPSKKKAAPKPKAEPKAKKEKAKAVEEAVEEVVKTAEAPAEETAPAEGAKAEAPAEEEGEKKEE